MKRALVAVIACLMFYAGRAHSQAVIGDVLRLTPTPYPTTCNNGDIRVNQTSFQVSLCVSNAWEQFVPIPPPTATQLGGVLAGTVSTNQFVIGISTAGTVTGAPLPTPTGATLGAIFSGTVSANQFLIGISTAGTVTGQQPAFSMLLGTAASTQLPLPGVGTPGAVMAFNSVAHEWINSIGATGSPTATQPTFADISGTVAGNVLPTLTGDIASSTAYNTTIAAVLGNPVNGSSGTGSVVFTAAPAVSNATLAGTTVLTGQMQGVTSSIAAPTYSFTGATSYGLYQINAASEIGIAVNGKFALDMINTTAGINLGVGQSAAATAANPFQVTTNFAGESFIQFNNANTTTASMTVFEVLNGNANLNNALEFGNGANFGNGSQYLSGGSWLSSQAFQTNLILGAANTAAATFIGFNVGGYTSSATQRVKLTKTALQLNSSVNLLMAGATSGTVTIGVNATAGSTTFNLPNTNGTASQFLQTDGAGNTTWTNQSAPVLTAYTTGSGNYTVPTGVVALYVKIIGAGGGGCGSGISGTNYAGGLGGVGGNTIFNNVTAYGGNGATTAGDTFGCGGGTGGTASGASFFLMGGNGCPRNGAGSTTIGSRGGCGGANPMGMGGAGGEANGGGGSNGAGFGGGGGGASSTTTTRYAQGGGGSGAYAELMLNTTGGTTYTYSIGAGGTAGTAGASGVTGGAGAPGGIVILGYY